MKVPFVNYPLQYKNLKGKIDKALNRTISRGDLILREDVEEFEQNLASYTKTKYAVGLNSCSDALIFSLMASGVGKGDEVITVSHTFFSTIEAIVHVGATPVLIDVGFDYLMDVEKIEQAVTSKTKAIIPVHLNGRVCRMDKIKRIAKRHNLTIIEDSAQALGAEYKGKKGGSFGLTGCFSFYPAKVLGALGDGGAITTNNRKVSERIRLLRNHGQKTKKRITCYGFTSRLDNLQAAVLNVKMKYLPEWLKRRREIAKKYTKGLSEVKGLKIPPSPQKGSRYDVFQNYVIRAEKRDKLYRSLREKGIETLIKDPIANHLQPGIGLSKFNLPLTEKLANEVISLPMYPEIKDRQVDYVIKTVKEFYES